MHFAGIIVLFAGIIVHFAGIIVLFAGIIVTFCDEQLFPFLELQFYIY